MPRDSRNLSHPHLEHLEDRLVPSTMAGSFLDGTWRYDTTAGWTHISAMAPNGLDVDDAGDVYARYNLMSPTDGLWRWSASTQSWQKLSNLFAQNFQVTASGVLYGDFGTNGVWRWDPNTGNWAQLSLLDVSLMTVSDNDSFFGRFDVAGAEGTWRWTASAGWSLLTANRPDLMRSDAAGDFVGVYNFEIGANQRGTWRWSPTSGWARLSNSPANIAVSTEGAIYEDRGPNGLWYAPAGATSFTQIDPAPQNIFGLFALPDGSLFFRRVDSPTTTSCYYWNPRQLGVGFVKVVPKAGTIIQTVLGKDGDLFFSDHGTIPATGYWSLTTPYRFLGNGNTQAPTWMVSQR
jgi:hypothetical protein